MAIYEQQTAIMGKGHVKTIDEGSIPDVLDMLQKHQYTYPIKSVARELISNGIDSISEKHVARQILTGKAKVEDYYVEREGSKYKDSHFDPSYYDLNWLSTEDVVELRYVIGSNLQKDKVIITDTGVGIGGKRLEGYFSLAFSTKRLSKLPLGKFGIGAKAPLSLGIDYYTIESRYNGQLFRFNSYAHSFESIIPQFDLERQTENPHVLFSPGTEHEYKVYWQPTTAKNGLSIVIAAKKGHMQQYIDAVKSQMLYFDNIRLVVEREDGTEDLIDYKAKILYENDHIVISDNNYYTKPHLLLNGVNYGYIDFSELELEDRNGNVGIKVAPEELDVSPNRERVLWTDRTKEMVNKRFLQVVDIASNMIQEELKEPDLIKWLRLCANVAGQYSDRTGIIGRLAKICDLASIRPKFSRDERIVFFQTTMLQGLYIRYVVMFRKLEANVYKNSIKRQELKGLTSQYISYPIFLMEVEEKVSNRKDKWLLNQCRDGFITITAPRTEEQMKLDGVSDDYIEFLRVLWAKNSNSIRPHEFWKYVTESIVPTWYKDIEVPADFTGNDEEEEEDTISEESKEEKAIHRKVATQTAAERRKAEGKIIIYTPMSNSSNGKYFEWKKLEQKISDINNWDQEEIYYGSDIDDELLHFVAGITRDADSENNLINKIRRSHSDSVMKWREKKWFRIKGEAEMKSYNIGDYHGYYCQHFFDNQEIRLVKASQTNIRYLRDFRHIKEFFVRIHNNTITMSNILIKWNTARIIKENLSRCAFLYNFQQFNGDFSNLYTELGQYVRSNYREVESLTGDKYGFSVQAYKDLINHLEKVRKFQDFITHNPDDKVTIANLAGELFGNKQISDGQAVDLEMIIKLNAVVEYAIACGPLLNHIPILTAGAGKIPEELEAEIKSYLSFKGVLDYECPISTKIEALQTGSENSAMVLEEAPETSECPF